MKLFQNPYVVGALALVAAFLVFRSAIQPLLKRSAPAKAQPVARTTPPAPAAVAEKQTPPPPSPAPRDVEPVEPKTRIDLALVGWNFNGSPPRDPFQLSESLMPPAQLTPPASEVLNLTAIWRQTGDSLAVINGRILRPGDSIEGFQIESIENNFVWVRGPAGRESLEFKLAAPTQTNAGPKTASTTRDATTGR